MQRVEDEEAAVMADGREQAYSLGRVLAISDGVFAFALTLLVVQLAIPTASGQDSLASLLMAQGPSYFSYALSFAVIAATWSGHHDMFKYVRRVDGILIALNFGSLLLIAVLPFPTAVLGHNQAEPLAALLYAIVIVLTGAASSATWWYATRRRRLVSADLSARDVRLRFYRALTMPVVFLVTIPLALWKPIVAEVAWGAIWVVFYLAVRPNLGRLA